MMTTKKFIFIIISIIVIGLVSTAVILLSMGDNSENDFSKGEEPYEATSQDIEELSFLADDYITRVGNFGVQLSNEELENDNLRMEHLDSVRLSNREPDSSDFISRQDSYVSSIELLSSDSNLRFSFDESENLDLATDLTRLRSYETEINEVKVNDKGIYLNIDVDESIPSVIVEVDVSSEATERVFATAFDEYEEEGNIFVDEYKIDETFIGNNQKILLTAVKMPEAGWKIYDVREIDDSRFLSNTKITDNALSELFSNGNTETFFLKVSDDEMYHAH